jgi:hypothetical protein
VIAGLAVVVALISGGPLLFSGSGGGPDGCALDGDSAVAGAGQQVMATVFGGPADASTHGSSRGAGGDLEGQMAWAELSNNWRAAATGDLDFAALGGLPMRARLRITYGGRSVVAQKLDVGRGGPPINGQARKLDLWWQTARALRFPGTGLVQIEILDDASTQTASECQQAGDAGEVAGLATTPGPIARIDRATGAAIAPQGAPLAVKRMLAAGNRIRATTYSESAPHGTPRTRVLDHYDCSSAVAYVLYWGGALDSATRNEWSGSLMSRGRPGRGRWVTWYADTDHVYLEVAGIRLDTSGGYGGPNVPAGSGPRWRATPRPAETKVARHPPGL